MGRSLCWAFLLKVLFRYKTNLYFQLVGWERAEKEVSVLKIQNESLTHKNLILEESVGHLDEALKECLRQHRQAREEEEDKIQNAVANSSREWESYMSQLENQLSDLRTQLQNANAKLEVAEKDKSALELQLQIRSREMDFTTRAAEAASKQHLDSRKKLAMLEAECLQLKARARRATDTASSLYVESFTDGHSDIGERVQVIEDDSCKASLTVPSVDIYLMDDFLEMERLASLPEGTSETSSPSRGELEAMIHRRAELEDTLEKITAEKARLEIDLVESRIQLKASDDQLKFTEAKLVDMKIQLALANEDAKKEVERTKVELNLNTLLDVAENNLEKVQHQLKETNQAKSIVEMQLEDATVKKKESEARLKLMELELERCVSTLEREVEKEKIAVAKCAKLEAEISRIKSDAQFQRSAEFRINQVIYSCVNSCGKIVTYVL